MNADLGLFPPFLLGCAPLFTTNNDPMLSCVSSSSGQKLIEITAIAAGLVTIVTVTVDGNIIITMLAPVRLLPGSGPHDIRQREKG